MRQAVPCRDLAGRPVYISERAVVRERAPGERFEWRDAPRAWRRRHVESPCCSPSAWADRYRPLAERRVYGEEAIRIQQEDARHEREETIKDSREKPVSGERQDVCRISWKEGVQRRSEETLGFPTEVIRRREEARRSPGITENHNEKSLNRGSRVGAAAARIDLLVVGEVDWRTSRLPFGKPQPASAARSPSSAGRSKRRSEGKGVLRSRAEDVRMRCPQRRAALIFVRISSNQWVTTTIDWRADALRLFTMMKPVPSGL